MLNFNKTACAFMLLLTTLTAAAQVSFISVATTHEYSSAEDFNNTYELRIPAGPDKEKKCQAVRVHKNWFFTAAHCVADTCAGSCSLRLVLYKDKTTEIYTLINHTPKNNTVFFDKNFSFSSKGNHASDIAVFKYNPQRQLLYFVVTSGKTKYIYSAQQFLTHVPKSKRILEKVNSKNNYVPHLPVISFNNAYYKLNRVLSIVSIDDDLRSVKASSNVEEDEYGSKNPAYFLKTHRILMVPHFGSKQGLSGSGVMTNTGELAGIVSFDSDFSYYENGKLKKLAYSGFASFNDLSLNFVKNAMGQAAFEELTIYEASENGFGSGVAYTRLPRTLRLYIEELNRNKNAAKP